MASIPQIALTVGDWLQYAGLILAPLWIAPLLILVAPRFATLPQAIAVRVDVISMGFLRIAGWAGFIMAIAMMGAVIMRYVFGMSFGWLKDIWVYAFAACFMLGSAGALKTGAHVRVDILYSNMSAKKRAIVDLAGAYLALLPLMVLILIAYAPQLARAWGDVSGRMELSLETDGLPLLFLFKTLVPVFAATMLAQGWANAVHAACVLRNVEPATTDAPHGEGPVA